MKYTLDNKNACKKQFLKVIINVPSSPIAGGYGSPMTILSINNCRIQAYKIICTVYYMTNFDYYDFIITYLIISLTTSIIYLLFLNGESNPLTELFIEDSLRREFVPILTCFTKPRNPYTIT